MKALILEGSTSTDETMTVTPEIGHGGVDVEIVDPWSGDTEAGFGNSLGFSLSREHVVMLRDHLNAVIAQWAEQ